MVDGIAVSIICNTYNHKTYIADALKSFVMQKTTFSFEILVHDDASTDGTADIIREFEKRYPEIIKPIYETENQYSKHDGSLAKIQFGRVQGKYIALCEGDDFWVDPFKIQKQFDAMEKHPEVDMCAHGAFRIDAETGEKVGFVTPSEEDTILSPEQVILGGGGYLATCSLFYRAGLSPIKDSPRFRKNLNYDYTCQIHGSLRGGILYLHEIMSVYRVNVAGSWTVTQRRSRNLTTTWTHKVQRMLQELDEDTNYRYSDTIQKRILKNEYDDLIYCDNSKSALSKKYREIYKAEPFNNRLKIWIGAYCPHIMKLIRKIRKR